MTLAQIKIPVNKSKTTVHCANRLALEVETPVSLILFDRPAPHVAVLRLNRPEVRNALSLELRRILAERVGELGADAETRCLVLTGGEKVFAAGADIKEMADAEPVELMQRNVQRYWQAIAGCPKPLIAAVEGYALGGGMELAMCADIIVAGETAQFGQPEVRVGILPGGGGTQRLSRAIGKYAAMRLLLTGQPIGAVEAHTLGLVSEIAPAGNVLARAIEIAQAIAALPPLAVMQIKELVNAGLDAPLDTGLMLERKAFQLLFASRDQKEGMRAFLEKRKPVFEGR